MQIKSAAKIHPSGVFQTCHHASYIVNIEDSNYLFEVLRQQLVANEFLIHCECKLQADHLRCSFNCFSWPGENVSMNQHSAINRRRSEVYLNSRSANRVYVIHLYL